MWGVTARYSRGGFEIDLLERRVRSHVMVGQVDASRAPEHVKAQVHKSRPQILWGQKRGQGFCRAEERGFLVESSGRRVGGQAGCVSLFHCAPPKVPRR